MDVPKEMKRWTHAPNPTQEIFAARTLRHACTVTKTLWRTVCNQDVGFFWDERPPLIQRAPTWQVEGPTVVFGLPRAAPKSESFDLSPFILKVGDVLAKKSQRLLSPIDEAPVVVSGDDQLDGMR
ncbi:MAG TPA: hypothetical protein VNG33_17315 [Polyangiaceae bacterium]|nr:hypothetical protein [Polyangiaceae bacterium]